MEYIVKILEIEKILDNVKKIRFEKPKNYSFVSGQHTSISINTPKLKNKKRFFSFSSSAKEPYLESIIKIHKEREGFTKELNKLKVGDELIISEAKGKIKYIGKGIFIAGGVGITPFLSIFSELGKKIKKSRLFFVNKTKKDIIYEKKLKELFNDKIIFSLTREKLKGYENKRIDKSFLEKYIKNFNQNFYLCGDFKWILQLKKDLIELGAKKEKIISEV